VVKELGGVLGGLAVVVLAALGGGISIVINDLVAIPRLWTGRDRVQFRVTTDTADLFADVAGNWTVHGATARLSDNGTFTYDWNAGPCLDSFATEVPMCQGHATATLVPGAGGRFDGTWTRVWYTTWDGDEPPAGFAAPEEGIEVGQKFWLKRNDAHTLITGGGTASDPNGPGNPYLCDDYAVNHNDSTYQLCGA
jgi:hypothetical protein